MRKNQSIPGKALFATIVLTITFIVANIFSCKAQTEITYKDLMRIQSLDVGKASEYISSLKGKWKESNDESGITCWEQKGNYNHEVILFSDGCIFYSINNFPQMELLKKDLRIEDISYKEVNGYVRGVYTIKIKFVSVEQPKENTTNL